MATLPEQLLEISMVGNTINSWLNLIIFALALKYALQVKLKDYWLIAIYFFIWSPISGWILTSLFGIPPGANLEFVDPDLGISGRIHYSLRWTIFSLDSLILAIIAIRAKYGELHDSPGVMKGLVGSVVVLVVISWITTNQVSIISGNPLSGVRYLSTFYGRLVGHSIVFYCFLTADYVGTPNTKRSRYLWIGSSMFQILAFILAFIPVFFFLEMSTTSISLVFTFFFLFIVLGNFLLFLNHLLFPEAVLFTHYQLVHARDLYDNVEKRNNLVSDIGINRIRDYLDSIDEETWEQVQAINRSNEENL